MAKCSQIDPFYGQIDPFYGHFDCFLAILPVLLPIWLYYGQIDRFNGQIDRFYDKILTNFAIFNNFLSIILKNSVNYDMFINYSFFGVKSDKNVSRVPTVFGIPLFCWQKAENTVISKTAAGPTN